MDKAAWLADEILMLNDGGEMPEVAYHSSLYFLCQDPDGPQLELDEADLLALKGAVVGRYKTIIMRDLTPENRFTSIYRGVERSCANWQRLEGYGRREGLTTLVDDMRPEIARALLAFLRQEYHDVVEAGQPTSINCDATRLNEFGTALGLELESAFPIWRELFAKA